MSRPLLYFKESNQWYDWLHENHKTCNGVDLVFYKIETGEPAMRWEEAVRVALCFGWIDSTVRSLGDGRRKQTFTPRKAKSVWSALNKRHIEELIAEKRMHASGLESIILAKENGSWASLDDVENGIIPLDLQEQFDKYPQAFANYQNFSPSYRKSYLYWLNQAKRQDTRQKRIEQIVVLCERNIKSRS